MDAQQELGERTNVNKFMSVSVAITSPQAFADSKRDFFARSPLPVSLLQPTLHVTCPDSLSRSVTSIGEVRGEKACAAPQ